MRRCSAVGFEPPFWHDLLHGEQPRPPVQDEPQLDNTRGWQRAASKTIDGCDNLAFVSLDAFCATDVLPQPCPLSGPPRSSCEARSAKPCIWPCRISSLFQLLPPALSLSVIGSCGCSSPACSCSGPGLPLAYRPQSCLPERGLGVTPT